MRRMMVVKKRIEITVETDETLVIDGRRRLIRSWCEQCNSRVSMVTADEAAATTGVSTREIYRRIDAGGIHFVEMAGQAFICSDSLRGRIGNRLVLRKRLD